MDMLKTMSAVQFAVVCENIGSILWQYIFFKIKLKVQKMGKYNYHPI